MAILGTKSRSPPSLLLATPVAADGENTEGKGVADWRKTGRAEWRVGLRLGRIEKDLFIVFYGAVSDHDPIEGEKKKISLSVFT